MNDEQIRAAMFDILKVLAPEVDTARIVRDKPLRKQIDLDSMDWLNVLEAIREKFGVTVPETDYAKVVTLDGIVGYLAERGASLPEARS